MTGDCAFARRHGSHQKEWQGYAGSLTDSAETDGAGLVAEQPKLMAGIARCTFKDERVTKWMRVCVSSVCDVC